MNTSCSATDAAASNVRFSRIAASCRLASICGLALALALPAAATPFVAVNLVTDDQSANAAQITDPNLVNAWGISHSGSGPFWVSSNEKGLSTLYQVDPASNATIKLGLEVAIPGAGNVTGQVFNPAAASGNFNGDLFLFVSEDGTVSGWRGALGTSAETLASASVDNAYKGSAISVIAGNAYLYAADFTGGIDVYKGNAAAPDLAGTFTDPGLPSGYAPFNIQNLGDTLYVTYAVRNPTTGDDVAGPGNGIVDAFDLQGNFLGRVGSNGTLNSPWGLALAPASFLEFAGDLLVGNFGDGRINVFDLATDMLVGQLLDREGNPLAIDGLWGLIAGNDGSAGSTQKIYFSAGPGDEGHGLFGVIQVPEPASLALVGLGIMLLGAARRRALQ